MPLFDKGYIIQVNHNTMTSQFNQFVYKFLAEHLNAHGVTRGSSNGRDRNIFHMKWGKSRFGLNEAYKIIPGKEALQLERFFELSTKQGNS